MTELLESHDESGVKRVSNSSDILFAPTAQEAAELYSQFGWAVVPAYQDPKKDKSEKTPLHFAYTALAVLRLPAANFNFTRGVSLVLDHQWMVVDIDAGGDRARELVETAFGKTPLVVRSRNDRYKLFYKTELTVENKFVRSRLPDALVYAARQYWDLGTDTFKIAEDDTAYRAAEKLFKVERTKFRDAVGAHRYQRQATSQDGSIKIEFLGFCHPCAVPPSQHKLSSTGRYTWEQWPTSDLVSAVPAVSSEQVDILGAGIDPLYRTRSIELQSAVTSNRARIRWHDLAIANLLVMLTGTPDEKKKSQTKYNLVAKIEGREMVSEGNRNRMLYSVAFNIGRLVELGVVSRDDSEEQLLEAARAIELKDKEARSTIRSGLDAGENTPLQQPYWLDVKVVSAGAKIPH